MNHDEAELPLPKLAPGPASQSQEGSELHHLAFDRKKGWILRMTIDLGPKRMGKRVQVRLGTKDKEEALVGRQTAFKLCKAFGLKLADRRQKRPFRVKGDS